MTLTVELAERRLLRLPHLTHLESRGRYTHRPCSSWAGFLVGDVDPGQIDERFIPARAAPVYTVELEGEAVLLDEDSNRLHLLNPIATLLWACFDGTSTVEEILTDLAEALDTPYDTVLHDTLDVLERLGQEGLLDGVAHAPSDTRDPTEAEEGEADVAGAAPATQGPYRFLEEPPNP